MKTIPATLIPGRKTKSRLLFVGTAVALFQLAALPSSKAAVLYDLNATVLDGGTGENTFMVQNSQTGSGLAYTGGGSPSLTYTEGASFQFTYFLGYFDPVTLTNINDSITLSYNLEATSGAFRTQADSGAFRFGLLDSNGSKISANIAGAGDTAFNNYEGYGAFYDPNAEVGGNDRFKQRTATNTTLMSVSAFTDVSTTSTAWTGSMTTISGTYTLTRVATGLEITSVINGGTPQTVTDTSDIDLTFDTFSFGTISGSSAPPTLTFSNLTVTSVPEPSVGVLAALGLGALSLLRRVRYRRTV